MKNTENRPTPAVLLEYLDSIAATKGLAPGLAGEVKEPWERLSVDDGTGPGRDWRGNAGTWHEHDVRERQARADVVARTGVT